MACAHEIVAGGLCVSCGAAVEASAAEGRRDIADPSAPGGIKMEITKAAVAKMEKEAEARLLAGRKLQLVLDLDETLLNTAREPHVTRAKELLDAVQGGAAGLQARDFHALPSYKAMYMKLRPGVDDFLAQAATMYELCIFTKGGKGYAADIVKVLDPTGKLFRGRVISHQECSDFAKSLHVQHPCPDSMILIIDDREDTWKDSNPDNVIRCVPYHFWPMTWEVEQSHINKAGVYSGPPSLEARLAEFAAHDDTDTQLADVLQVLRELHTEFYAAVELRAQEQVIGRPLRAFICRSLLAILRSAHSCTALWPLRLQKLREELSLTQIAALPAEVVATLPTEQRQLVEKAAGPGPGQPSPRTMAQQAARYDVKQLLRARRHSVLSGLNVLFSRCFDRRLPSHENDLW